MDEGERNILVGLDGFNMFQKITMTVLIFKQNCIAYGLYGW